MPQLNLDSEDFVKMSPCLVFLLRLASREGAVLILAPSGYTLGLKASHFQ